ncbi:DEAD/DEAH box helicase family protein [Streptomyces sp. NPDC059459]|uniref:DEAD/DEAH box helicase family protein n=1 Tax=Streptomyces sp. NPDC059459 TaxID=3346839 RepID=UPI00369D6D40
MAVKLRDHQIAAVAAIVRGFNIPPGGIPWNGLRGQVHAACGTGKTIIAAASAKPIVPKGARSRAGADAGSAGADGEGMARRRWAQGASGCRVFAPATQNCGA